MGNEIDYGLLRDDQDMKHHADVLAWSFHFPAESSFRFFDMIGRDKVRVLRKDGKPVAGLSLFPMGQWIGGRHIDMVGVNLVGVAPDHRGGGTATQLMKASLREMYDGGTPISVLYPAKQTLYRRAGYELAGTRFQIDLDLRDVTSGDRTAPLRAIEPGDFSVVDELHRRYHGNETGPVSRPEYMWKKLVTPLDKDVRGFLIEGDDGPEGYIYVMETPGEGFLYNLELRDSVALTERAGRRILGFLTDHASMARCASWFGNPVDSTLMLLLEQRWRAKAFFHWMLRIVNVSAALQDRGYVTGSNQSVSFRVRDEMLPENDVTWKLTVEDGKAEVSSASSADVEMDVRGLAAIYTGFLTPAAAARSGLLSGPSEDLQKLQSLFAGPHPWMSDMF